MYGESNGNGTVNPSRQVLSSTDGAVPRYIASESEWNQPICNTHQQLFLEKAAINMLSSIIPGRVQGTCLSVQEQVNLSTLQRYTDPMDIHTDRHKRSYLATVGSPRSIHGGATLPNTISTNLLCEDDPTNKASVR